MSANTHTEENYLKALYSLTSEREEVNLSELAKSMEVSMPTVNSMVKRLSDRGLLYYEKYKPLRLTNDGQKVAAEIIRKHRLTEMFLVERMGFGWEEVHNVAEQIEHIHSEHFFDRMDEILGFPRFDPHGSPIPDKNGEVITQELVELANCEVGEKVILKALNNSSEELLKYLTSKDLSIGADLTIVSREDFDESLTVRYDGHKSEVFSRKVCKRLMVIIGTKED